MKYYTFLRESLTLALRVVLFVTLIAIIVPAALSHPEQETYTEGNTFPICLHFSIAIAVEFHMEWEIRRVSEDEGTPADESDYFMASNTAIVEPFDGGWVHVGDIEIIDDNVVEGPEIFDMYLTGAFVPDSNVNPDLISLGPPRRWVIVDTLPPDPLPPDPPDHNDDDEKEKDDDEKEKPKQTKKSAAYYCPLGWKKQDPFGNPTKRVLLHAVEMTIDMDDRSGIYKPVAIEIYADPTEGLINLDGWKLTLALPYNHGTDYQLTAENSTFNENNIARIESPLEVPFPMTDAQFSGQWLPGFDYRLFDENNTRVDFGISCYRHNDLQGRLESMEIPRVERDIIPPVASDEVLENVSWRTRLDWESDYYFSYWLVPKVAPAVPGAPAAVRKPLTTSWAALKRNMND